jgi:VIT1/CCC1 family predicted Fe2+/Mn2+ transporter
MWSFNIGGSYIAGGLIPLLPYIIIPHPNTALLVSVVVTLCALLIFGAVKGRFTGVNAIWSGLQTALIGGAAGAAFLIARLISR